MGLDLKERMNLDFWQVLGYTKQGVTKKEVVHCSFSIDGADSFTHLAYLHLAAHKSSHVNQFLFRLFFCSLKHKV